MQLTRDRIIEAAVQLIEREGVDAVSMRRVAIELGSGVMSLYNHVPSKAALLDGVVERVAAGIEIPAPTASWEDDVRAQARAFRAIAHAYPRCTMLVVSRPASTAATRTIGHAMATLQAAGFGEDDAARTVRAFVAYIVGSLLREVGVSPSVVPAADPQAPARTSRAEHDADFEFGLETLLRGAADRLREVAGRRRASGPVATR
ncbi:MAG: TetR/AcrR family transcriptional regulator C-terminal domain-containing protein [Actinomycetota bacterium]